MKKEYDFSKGVKGKFFTEPENIEIPVYLDKTVKEFYLKAAMKKNISIDKLVNSILKKEMEMIRAISDGE
jgi:hypothetical protein